MTHTELTGAFLDIEKVTDPDGSPTVTALGFTHGDVEVSIDEDEASAEAHSDRRRVRRRTYNEAGVSFESHIEATAETFDETGLINTSDQGRMQWNATDRTWDACQISIYEEAEDTSPKQVVRLDEVEWETSGITLPSDFATAEIEGMVHGDIYFDANQIT